MENVETVSTQAKQLLNSISSLSTFNQVKEWDEKATTHISKIVETVAGIETETDRVKQELQHAQQEHEEKAFLSRLFSGRPERKFNAVIAKHENQKNSLESLAEELQAKIDFTPNSPEEQTILIKELRQRKKEINANKREIAATMKEIRTKARQESAEASYSFSALVAGTKYTASQRRAIRYEKEAKLAPHEDEKAAFERQLVEVDRFIIWAERFK